MISYIRLKPGVSVAELKFCQFAAPEWSFAVQSGLLVMRHADQVYSIPLTDVAVMRGSPAAPPKAKP